MAASRRDLSREMSILALRARGLTQREVADRLDIHRRTVIRTEQRWDSEGVPPVELLEEQIWSDWMLARSLHVRLGLLQAATKLAFVQAEQGRAELFDAAFRPKRPQHEAAGRS